MRGGMLMPEIKCEATNCLYNTAKHWKEEGSCTSNSVRYTVGYTEDNVELTHCKSFMHQEKPKGFYEGSD